MSDAQLFWFDYGGDINISNGDIEIDSGLATAILIALFTDSRAPSEDMLDIGQNSLRGWWGSEFSEDDSQIGSLLWLLNREKARSVIASEAFDFCTEALKFIKDYDIAENVYIDSRIIENYTLQIIIKVQRGNAKKYENLWKGSLDYKKVSVQKTSIEIQFIE